MQQSDTSPKPGYHWLKRYFDTSTPNGLLRTLKYAGAGLALIVFCVLLVLVHHASSGVLLDHRLQYDAYAHRNAALTWLFLHISELASVAGLLVFAACACALLYRHHRKLAVLLVIAVAIDGIVTEVLKKLVGRARPDTALSLVHETSFSFPSGHTMAATLCWGMAAYFIGRSCRHRWQRWVVFGLYVVAVLLVAGSRIYLGAHYSSDVAGSILLGGGLLGLLLSWLVGHPSRLPAELFDRQVIRSFVVAFAILIVLSLLLPRLFT